MADKNNVNREYKSSLFSYIFSQKEYALHEKIIREQDEDLYGSILIKIPTPTCIVFYNGPKNEPDSTPLYLSDAFINREAEASLELIVKMININYDYNQDLMAKCEALYGYSLYISKVREYNNTYEMDIQEASIKALDKGVGGYATRTTRYST